MCRKALLALLLLLIGSSHVGATPCWKNIFEWNEKNTKKHRLLILPFENATALHQDDWISFLFPIILQDYLSLSDSTLPLISVSAPRPAFFDPARAVQIGKKAEADYLIIGQFSRVGQQLQISTRLLEVKTETEAGRWGGLVEFPGTRMINDFLIDLTDYATRTFKPIKLSKKKILPYRNETSSAEALRYFILGTVSLKQGTRASVEEAIKRFEQSIRNDYNYTPSYLGLSLASARRGFVQNAIGTPYREAFLQARVNLEKGKVLKRFVPEEKIRTIEIYLEAETHYRLAEKYAAEGEIKKAIGEIKQALEKLRGDFSSRQRLIAYLNQLGRDREAREEQEIVDQLTACGENE